MPLARRLLGGCLAVPVTVGLAACGSPQRTMSDQELAERSEAGLHANTAAWTEAVDRLLHRTKSEAEAGGTLDILAISGGGDFGAFGAGVLVGWGSAPGDAHRPVFDVVTGVSTGALLSPFAFVGTDEACLKVEDFYRNPRTDWVSERGLLFFWPTNPSFMKIAGLTRDIRGAVDEEFIAKIGEEAQKGRALMVGATSLDFGRQQRWNLAAEAAAAKDAAGVARVQDMLLASAAIPAVFPPVEIDGLFYADGGVTANVLLSLEVNRPEGLLPRWIAEMPGTPLPKVRYWIIINNQIQPPPRVVQPRWPSIIAPSLATSIRSATLAEVRWIAARADHVNAAFGADIEVRVIAIPNDWTPPVEGDFQKETMDSLADLGRTLGADANSWTLWTLPVEARPGARGR